MKKLLMLAIAAMAFAIPASASADPAHFTHEGLPVEETTEVTLTGTNIQFTNESGAGVNCPHAEIKLDLLPGGVGEVTTFDTTTHCTVLGAGLLTHADPINIHQWTVTADPDNERIILGNVHITNTITVGGQVAAENTLEGHEIWVNVNSNEPISTGSLDNPLGGVTVNGANVDVHGEVHVLKGTEIGQATT